MMGSSKQTRAGAAAFLALALGVSPAAGEPCGICAETVVVNSGLASCFLDRFGEFQQADGTAVAVDLSDCPQDRGVVEALPGVGAAEVLDLKFLLSRAQLDCFKGKLEAPGVVLDPQAVIDLGSCG